MKLWIEAIHIYGFPGSSVGKETNCNSGDPSSIPGLGRSTGEGISYPLQYSWGFPCGSAGKESACNAGDLDSIPGLGRPPEEGKCCPLQYSGLENSMDCIAHGVSKSLTWLSNFRSLTYVRVCMCMCVCVCVYIYIYTYIYIHIYLSFVLLQD